jgi:hypothetical protein
MSMIHIEDSQGGEGGKNEMNVEGEDDREKREGIGGENERESLTG